MDQTATPPPIKPIVLPPNAGRVLRAFGEHITFHLTGADTAGRLTMFTEVTPPGGGPPPHFHELEDEWFFPLEGRVEFYLDGQWTEAAARSVVFMPRGTVHAFRNPGDQSLTMLIQTAPAGFDEFMTRCAAEFAQPAGPDMARIVAIGADHGIHFVDG